MSKFEDLCKALDSAVGENHGNAAPTKFINTGYGPLNEIISGKADGGLPFGRMLEMFGDSSSGKTALATQWMIQAQRMGGCAIFIDWERSFNIDMAKSMGLNDERPYWVYLKPKTWEQGNMMATKACQAIRASGMIDKNAPILVVFDSIASAVPKSVTEKELDELTMNDTTALARVSSTTLKTQAQWAEEFDATFLYLNQIRLKPGVAYGDPTTTPGGKAMEFYSTVRLSLSRSKVMQKGDDGEKEFVGQEITIKTTKNKLTKPFQNTSLRLSFDEIGMAVFDFESSLLDKLTERGKLKQSGARVEWTDGKSYYKKALLEKIKAEGLKPELEALLYA